MAGINEGGVVAIMPGSRLLMQDVVLHETGNSSADRGCTFLLEAR